MLKHARFIASSNSLVTGVVIPNLVHGRFFVKLLSKVQGVLHRLLKCKVY